MTNYITYEVRVYTNGDKAWYLNGQFHREDGLAVEWADGLKAWYLNGKLHREDGPAIEHSDSHKAWYLNGKRNREGGPAVEYADGDEDWFLNGEYLTEEEHQAAMNPTVEMTMEEICKALGKTVKVVK
jgi:hypothetical protein